MHVASQIRVPDGRPSSPQRPRYPLQAFLIDAIFNLYAHSTGSLVSIRLSVSVFDGTSIALGIFLATVTGVNRTVALSSEAASAPPVADQAARYVVPARYLRHRSSWDLPPIVAKIVGIGTAFLVDFAPTCWSSSALKPRHRRGQRHQNEQRPDEIAVAHLVGR